MFLAHFLEKGISDHIAHSSIVRVLRHLSSKFNDIFFAH